MRSSLGFLAAAMVAGAAAIPQTLKFSVTGFEFSQAADGTISNLGFDAWAEDDQDALWCFQDSPPSPPVESWVCSNLDYSFAAHFDSPDSVRLRIYHQLDDGTGYWGEGNIPIGCTSDGDCYGVDSDDYWITVDITLTYENPPNWP